MNEIPIYDQWGEVVYSIEFPLNSHKSLRRMKDNGELIDYTAYNIFRWKKGFFHITKLSYKIEKQTLPMSKADGVEAGKWQVKNDKVVMKCKSVTWEDATKILNLPGFVKCSYEQILKDYQALTKFSLFPTWPERFHKLGQELLKQV